MTKQPLCAQCLEALRHANMPVVDSGIEHYKHMACNLAFLCDMLQSKKEDQASDISAKELLPHAARAD